jgi:hypothetical protein
MKSIHFRLITLVVALGVMPRAFAVKEVGPREAYNHGEESLRKGYLREAEAWFLRSLAEQRESLQPPALYNLGHTRFGQGRELLKGESPRQALLDRAETTGEDGADAIARASGALKSDNLNTILEAYMNGRVTRKQLRLANEDVQRALDLYGSVLVRWRRSVGDFRSADELRPSEDAAFNAKVVERHIEELLKHVKQLEQQKEMLGKMRGDLKQKMKELRGKIPQEMMQPGQGDPDEEDEEEEDGKDRPTPESGFQDRQKPDGDQRGITPEIAQQILEALGLKGDRKLPLGGNEPQPPRDRKGRDW